MPWQIVLCNLRWARQFQNISINGWSTTIVLWNVLTLKLSLFHLCFSCRKLLFSTHTSNSALVTIPSFLALLLKNSLINFVECLQFSCFFLNRFVEKKIGSCPKWCWEKFYPFFMSARSSLSNSSSDDSSSSAPIMSLLSWFEKRKNIDFPNLKIMKHKKQRGWTHICWDVAVTVDVRDAKEHINLHIREVDPVSVSFFSVNCFLQLLSHFSGFLLYFTTLVSLFKFCFFTLFYNSFLTFLVDSLSHHRSLCRRHLPTGKTYIFENSCCKQF